MGLNSVEVPPFFGGGGGQFAIAQIAITTAMITMYRSWLGAHYWCTRHNTMPYALFALKKRHGFRAKAREKNMQRHRLGRLWAQLRHVLKIAKAHFRHSLGTV